jgi:PAS domain S-box-containing protein
VSGRNDFGALCGFLFEWKCLKSLPMTSRDSKPPEPAMLAAIIESSTDAIISKDLNGIINSWNTAAERLFGYSAGEAIGKPVTILIPPERYDEEPAILARIRRGESIDHYETVRRRKDGSLLDIALTVSPIKDSVGRIIGASKIARDITASKKAERELRTLKDELTRSNQELERRVQERTSDLERANAAMLRDMEERRKLEEQLRQAQRLESIAILAGGIAHDFNNILNIIRGYSSLLQRLCSTDEKLSGPLKIIEESVDRGASVVRQLLAVSRKTEATLERIDVNRMLENLTPLLSETFPKTIEILLRLDPELPRLIADSTQLHQVFLNLCVNARDAMPDGGKLYIETGTVEGDDLRHRFSAVGDRRYACVTIRDTGIGMDKGIQSRIFDPFFTTKEPGQGTGLGLSVVYGIITGHAGFIDVMSEPGQGTTFDMYLPIREAPDANDGLARATTEDKSPDSSNRDKTILLVEDEVEQLNLMQSILESEGYRVLRAKDGAEAVESHATYKSRISVVILDLGLPKLSGWAVLEKMKKADASAKVILATGFISPELQTEIKQGNITGVILKPYRIDDVLEKISTAIKAADGQDANISS